MNILERIDKRTKIAPHHAVTMENAAIAHHFHDALTDYSRPHPAAPSSPASAATDDCDFFSFFQTTDATLVEIRNVLEQMRRYSAQSDDKSAADRIQLQSNLNNAYLTISRLAGALALRAQQQICATSQQTDNASAMLTTLSSIHSTSFTLAAAPVSAPERLQAALKKSATTSRRIECFTSRLGAAFTIQ